MRLLGLTTILVLVSACGGGGGGSPPGSPPPPPPPASGGTLTINATTADAVALGVAMTEGALQFAQGVADGVIDYMKVSGGPDLDCRNVGSKSATHMDNDGDFFVSAGDTLEITYSGCFEPAVDDLMNGTLTIQITALEFTATRLEIAGSFQTSPGFSVVDRFDPANVVGVDANAVFSFVVDGTEVLEVSGSGPQSITLTIAGIDESVSQFLFRKTAVPPPPGGQENRWSTEIDVQEVYQSGILGGSFTCSSTIFNFDATDAFGPETINFVCRGLNGSAVRIIGQRTVELDDNADGVFVSLGIIDWPSISEGFLGRAEEKDLSELRGSAPIGTLQISANDAEFDVVGNRLLVVTKAGDSLFPNALVESDAVSGTTTQLVGFTMEPSLVRISEDGSRIYVAFSNSGTVQRYDAATNELIDSVDVLYDPPTSDQEIILDLAISPADPELFVALFRFSSVVRHDLALIQGTSQLTNTYWDIEPLANPDRYNYVEFSSDGNTVIADARTILSFDGTGFTTLYKSRHGGASSFSRVGDRIYTSGHALDETTLIREGGFPVAGNKQVADPDNNRMIFYNFSSMSVGLLDQFSIVGEYDLDLRLPQGDTVSKMVAGGDRVFMLRDELINVIDVADLTDNITVDCVPTTLMTPEDEPYTRIECPVQAATYDASRNRAYLGVWDYAGAIGNTIATVDVTTNTVEGYTRVDSLPQALRMSADDNTLFVSSFRADSIKEIDTATMAVTRVTPIPLVPPIQPNVEAQPRVAIDLHASSIDSSLVVTQIGVGYGTPRFDEYVALGSGAWLDDKLNRSNSGSVQNRELGFDDVGTLFDIGTDLNGYVVENILVGLTGLTSVSVTPIDEPNAYATEFAISNGEAININGDVIDLATGTVEARFDMASAPDILSNGNTAEYVLVDETNGHTYFAYEVDSQPFPAVAVAKFDTATGQFEAAEYFEGNFERFPRSPFFEMGADKIGLLLLGSYGFSIIDKSSIN